MVMSVISKLKILDKPLKFVVGDSRNILRPLTSDIFYCNNMIYSEEITCKNCILVCDTMFLYNNNKCVVYEPDFKHNKFKANMIIECDNNNSKIPNEFWYIYKYFSTNSVRDKNRIIVDERLLYRSKALIDIAFVNIKKEIQYISVNFLYRHNNYNVSDRICIFVGNNFYNHIHSTGYKINNKIIDFDICTNVDNKNCLIDSTTGNVIEFDISMDCVPIDFISYSRNERRVAVIKRNQQEIIISNTKNIDIFKFNCDDKISYLKYYIDSCKLYEVGCCGGLLASIPYEKMQLLV